MGQLALIALSGCLLVAPAAAEFPRDWYVSAGVGWDYGDRVTFESNGALLEIDWAPFFGSIRDIAALRKDAAEYAMAFHQAVIDSAVAMIDYGQSKRSDRHIALSGGVLMNRIIHDGLTDRLRAMKLTPLTHSHTPPNDGCISLGQVVKASSLLRSN